MVSRARSRAHCLLLAHSVQVRCSSRKVWGAISDTSWLSRSRRRSTRSRRRCVGWTSRCAWRRASRASGSAGTRSRSVRCSPCPTTPHRDAEWRGTIRSSGERSRSAGVTGERGCARRRDRLISCSSCQMPSGRAVSDGLHPGDGSGAAPRNLRGSKASPSGHLGQLAFARGPKGLRAGF